MLQINEDINDELFRRAAESYPLKTDNPNWEAVLHKMRTADANAVAEPIVKKRKNNSRWLLLLLLLIPLAIFDNKLSPVKKPATGNSNLDPNKSALDVKELPGQSNQSVAIINDDIPDTQTNVTIAHTKTETINPVTNNPARIHIQKNNSPAVVTTTDDEIVAIRQKQRFSARKKSTLTIKNAQPVADEEVIVKYPVSTESPMPHKNESTSVRITTANQNETATFAEKQTATQNKIETLDIGKLTELSITANPDKETVTIANDKIIIKDSSLKKVEKDTTKKIEKNRAKADKKITPRTKHFYVGLLAGPDFSTIKLQSLKKTGFNYGFLIGYQVTKKISVEAGLLQDKKYYSTDGKYFSTKNTYLYPNSTIEYVDGVCKMLELPVNITYTFSKKAKSSWFGSVGVSSYFMQHESYTYQINYNGYTYPKDYDYSNKSTSLFALINISAGYTYKLGKLGDLRFEPFIKLPVNKIGTGELPIQSAGIFIGFTKMIF